ncbi:MAG: aldehyde dehydrogenase [Verrucomicrobiales bacterium]|nr:aldehyde dehydrogenase [Verrucomicrobiales bacterium]
MSVPHLPALRRGQPYDSLEKIEVKDHRTGELKAEVSQVNAGIIRKDMRRIGEARESLKKFTVEQLIEISARAGEEFLNGTLPLGDRGHTQSPEEYIATLSRTSGLPHAMVKRNMAKIHYALTHMRTILNGLSRGLDLNVIDTGFGEQAGCPVSYFPTTQCLGLVMPSNSPAVNSLWLPAIALKIPVFIKPGRDEPWTPFRLIQAFIKAGAPAEAFGFYPTDHEGSGEVIKLSGRCLVFGDVGTVKQHENNPAVQVHGPGWSKILIGADQVANWRDYIDVIVSSVSDNGGRSCINASAVLVPSHGREIADAIAQRLGSFTPLPPDDENAKLSGFANAKMAEYIDATIDADLKTPGAEDLTAHYRNGPRKVEFEGGTYLKPTVVFCEKPTHPLFNREFLCPFVSVVEVPQDQMLEHIGYTLVATAITQDEAFIRQLMESPNIDRLNIGPISTMKISWDQPHEGNMFEFLYKRRSIDRA